VAARKGELARTLRFLEAMTLGGGTMIGAGIFILPGIAAANARPASSISFLIGGLVALLAAISLSELATGMPVAGGSYHYVNRALGSFFGNIVGWGMWTGLVFGSAFYMIGAEVIVILIFLAVAVFFVDLANLEPFAPGGTSGIIATTGIIFVTFLGFEIIAIVVAAAVAAISSSNSSVLSAARVVYAMGRDHLVSDWLNATHSRFRTPQGSVLVTGVITSGLVLMGLLVDDIIALLAEVASFSFLVSYALVHVAVVVIRRAGPSAYEPDFRIPSFLYPTSWCRWRVRIHSSDCFRSPPPVHTRIRRHGCPRSSL
jgi:amino acid transporter